MGANCGGEMRIVSFIDEKAVAEKILRHCELWREYIPRPPPSEKPLPEEPVGCETLDFGFTSTRAQCKLRAELYLKILSVF
jgi:hypothetical protein